MAAVQFRQVHFFLSQPLQGAANVLASGNYYDSAQADKTDGAIT